MDTKTFQQFVAMPYELPNLEFKGQGKRDESPFAEKVVRAALGMSNLQGGGYIILGVADEHSVLKPIGLSPEQVTTWLRKDTVDDLINAYADPPIRLEVERHVMDEKEFVVLTVHETDQLPTICKKRYAEALGKDKEIMRVGGIYIRPDNKPETREVASASEMRVLLDRAVNQRLQREIQRLDTFGLLGRIPSPKSSTQYEQELVDWHPTLHTTIRERGYWDVIIRPQNYQAKRIASLTEVRSILTQAVVNERGWSFPFINEREAIIKGAHRIEQASNITLYRQRLESWCITQSGQFRNMSAFDEDGMTHEQWALGQVMTIESVVWRLTEVFALASRFCLNPAYHLENDALDINITLHGIRGRHLIFWSPNRSPIFRTYTADIPSYALDRICTSTEIIANHQSLAIDAALEIFDRFGWNADQDLLRGIQMTMKHS